MLTKLDLSWSRIDSNGVESIADALKENTTLTPLPTNGNTFKLNAVERAFMDALKISGSLMILSIETTYQGTAAVLCRKRRHLRMKTCIP